MAAVAGRRPLLQRRPINCRAAYNTYHWSNEDKSMLDKAINIAEAEIPLHKKKYDFFLTVYLRYSECPTDTQ
jgi:hypothetical protein